MKNTSANCIIRRATVNDLGQIASLYQGFWNQPSDLGKMLEKFSRIENNDHYVLMVAIKSNNVVGTIFGIVCEELYGNCHPFMVMENLIVSETEKRNGIGRLLLSGLQDYAVKMDCSQIQFITEAARKEAIGFYKSVGFKADEHIGFKKKL